MSFIGSISARDGRVGVGVGVGVGAGVRFEGALQPAVGTLHQHDIHDDERQIDQDRALCAKVERQPEAADPHLCGAGAISGKANDTMKPKVINVAINARLKRQYF